MEAELISRLRELLPPDPRLLLGPGDDAAVLRVAGHRCVVSTDMLGDGVDFLLAQCGPQAVGRKALAVNLSDLAAMAAHPLAAVVALTLPRRGALETALGLYEGMLPLAAESGICLAGGDTNTWDGPLSIAVTVLGEPSGRGPLTRAGARPGDAVIVSGRFGGSILGRHLSFTPRVSESLMLHSRYYLRAGMDVSDGLSLDLSRLCEESGCGAVIDPSAVPIHEDAHRLSTRDGVSPLDHALADGEDFELILAVSRDAARQMLADQPLGVPLTRIGEFCAERGMWAASVDGGKQPLSPRGYLHEGT